MMANRNDEALRAVSLAEAVARQAHAEHVDKSGAPYVGHLERVAAAVAPDADAMAVAWLHDLVEDQPHCAGYLMDFPPHIVRTVYLLTKVKNEPNTLYFARIKADPLALKVKLADIADNMSDARMGKLDALTQERLRAKYAAALALLTPRPEPAGRVEVDPSKEQPCNPHPSAPHGFDRTSSHSLGRYVCDCEGWAPDEDAAHAPQEGAE